ncbi:MAG TPA: aspartate dehydrogenase [Pyrinomonadaceae bacterium]|jgi:aspartate dehydrogenase|nr:aspartate dehydrogenase [Pyrinomonadaceae bacterium]
MRIGIIGFGTIGKAVVKAVDNGRAGDVEISRILVRDTSRIDVDVEGGTRGRVTSDPTRFFSDDIEVVVEAAGHGALKQYAEYSLRSGRDLLAVSVGAFADEGFLALIKCAAKQAKQRLLVPSGALGGLDAVSSAAVGLVNEVVLEVRKPVAAWMGTPAESVALRATDEAICFYEGKARDAVSAFPQNVNVLAALSLAGIGFDRTAVKMFVDPSTKHNTFHLSSHGEFGEVKLTLKNIPNPDNPKTGRLVVMSLIKAIGRLTQPIIVGF